MWHMVSGHLLFNHIYAFERLFFFFFWNCRFRIIRSRYWNRRRHTNTSHSRNWKFCCFVRCICLAHCVVDRDATLAEYIRAMCEGVIERHHSHNNLIRLRFINSRQRERERERELKMSEFRLGWPAMVHPIGWHHHKCLAQYSINILLKSTKLIIFAFAKSIENTNASMFGLLVSHKLQYIHIIALFVDDDDNE